MSRSRVDLLDLPNEILLSIFKKLDNIDVLYALSGINNERLDILGQEPIFSNVLNFVSLSTDDISSLPFSILDCFCSNILPRVHYNVKHLILDSTSMERILLAGDYPYLNELKLFSFNKDIVRSYFTDESPFRRIFRQQITDLSLVCNEYMSTTSWTDYVEDVYIHILRFFKNLTHLSIVGWSRKQCLPLGLSGVPSTTFSSSTLTSLCIKLNSLQDCISLLDGRLKQLSTLSVTIYGTENHSTFDFPMDNLSELKCFSLTYDLIEAYDNQVVPLLRRMSHLEELTLYLSIENRSSFVDGTHLYNEILIHMPRLRQFIFYIRSMINSSDSDQQFSIDSIQQTFNKIQYQEVACILTHLVGKDICHVFSLPFAFNRLKYIGNIFPDIAFNRVTSLMVFDSTDLEHEYLIRITRSFPFLKELQIYNGRSHMCFWIDENENLRFEDNQSYPIVVFPNLKSLDIKYADIGYVEQCLNSTKTHLPHLTKLKVRYDDLVIVTQNFTRDATRINCAKVKWLILKQILVHSKDVYLYFPSL